MPTSSETYWRISRLNRLFAAAAVLLLIVLVWVIGHDHDRPWRTYQHSARTWENAIRGDRVDPASVRPAEQVRQTVVREVLTDLSLAKVETVDRCMTCHVNIDRPEFTQTRLTQYLESQLATESATAQAALDFWRAWAAKLLPAAEQRRVRSVADIREAIRQRLSSETFNRLEDRYWHALLAQVNVRRAEKGLEPLDASPLMLAHPRLDLYLRSNSPHPLDVVGCTSCHDGSGQETNFALAAHTPKPIWVDRENGQPVLPQQINLPASTQPSDHSDEATYTDPATGQSGTAIPQARFWARRFGHESAAHLEQAHRDWDRPMLHSDYRQAACARCHESIHEIRDEAPLLHEGRALFARLGCANCHAMDRVAVEDKPCVGPDLRHITRKLSAAFIQSWIWSPRSIRPGTRMPHFFGQENNTGPEDVQRTQHEVRAMAAYLVQTATVPSLSAPMPGVSEDSQQLAARIARGRALFIGLSNAKTDAPSKPGGIGCLGCHTNANETGQAITQSFGPELGDIGTKLLHGGRTKADARRWLWQWLMDPRQHSAATRMPQLRCTPEEAIDLAEYLLALKGNSPAAVEGVVIPDDVEQGRKLIVHYGCTSCHAINGLEGTPSPGPNLSDWGQKRVDQLDFGTLKSQIEPTRMAWMDQKLRSPRIYDRGRMVPTLQKLRMPKFELSDRQIQALITFVISNRDRLIAPGLLARANTAETQTIARGRQIAERYNCVGCHRIDGPEPAIQQYWLRGYFDEADLVIQSPPSLRGEGSRVQHQWLYNYLRHVESEGINGRIRPIPSIRMPSFALSEEETAAVVAYFSAVARQESRQLSRHLEPLLRNRTWPEDNWYQDPRFTEIAGFLKGWAIANTSQKPIDFVAGSDPQPLTTAYKTALYDGRFITRLFDAPYPFVERSQITLFGRQLAKGEEFYHRLQCQTCHVLGNEEDGRVNPAPRGPNLSLAHRRLQRAWVRRWLQDPQVIRADAVMPSFFSGRGITSPVEPAKVQFDLNGLPYMLPPLTAEQIKQIQAAFGETVDQQTQLLLD
ncbi:MAG: c-type cytochrome, partial [Bacillota bacterium]